MFRDRLADLLRQSAGELGKEAEILEKAASIVNRARVSLEDLACRVECSGEGQRVTDLGDAVLEERDAEGYVKTFRSGPETEDGIVLACPGNEADCSRFEAALRDSKLTIKDRMIKKIRVLAQANDGLVSPGQAAPVILKLGLSTSRPRNLPGYMLHQMNRSGEFERVGEDGSGVYQWLPYKASAAQDGPFPENGVRALAAISPSYEEVAV